MIKQALKPAEPDNFGDQYLFREYAILGMPSRALGDDFNVISHTVSCVCIDSQRAALTSRSNKSEIREDSNYLNGALMTDPYLYTVSNNVATFSINDAPWNLMSLAYIDRLEEQLPEVLADDHIRAIVFTGEGLDHFSAGMNLKQLPDGIKRAKSPEAFFDQRHKVLDMIERGGTPTIATLFGYCLGGGLELPLACHFRIAAATGAQIGLPEMDLGTVPAWGGSARLPRAVGQTYALDMILGEEKLMGRKPIESAW